MIGVFQTVDDFHNDLNSKFGSPWEYRNGSQSKRHKFFYYDLTVAKACREGLKKSWSIPLSLINDYRLTVHNIKLS